ncbi:hypothetical protein D9757_004367 [Collybiopsis confluens]|uniref:HIG1 domain-containing protein n=1 Tax=Collybiopsis confluens TaxID=2823264 RepID=A0A8H5MD69_9AGAR|nr:hypothetical protein D9757_004367 [Collybiopsis confluens]
MSYAAAAGSFIPPNQPQPDQALLNTESPTAPTVADDTAKVNVVHPQFKEHPATITSQNRPVPPDSKTPSSSRRRLKEVEAEGAYLWNVARHYLFRPGVAGGLVGLINVGLLAGATRAFYTQPQLRNDRRIIASAVAATLVTLGVEGFAAEKYAQTPQGQAEARRARKKEP